MNIPSSYFDFDTDDVTSSTSTSSSNSCNFTDLSWALTLANNTCTATHNFESYRNYYQESLLMYKSWITIKQYFHYLFIQLIKKVTIKNTEEYIYKQINRKTVKSLSPIIRNHRYGSIPDNIVFIKIKEREDFEYEKNH